MESDDGCRTTTLRPARARPRRALALLLVVGLQALASAFDDPAAVTRTAAGAGGVPIAYDVAGSGDTTLVFVHGWCCDRTYWREQVPAFVDEYRVVTVDLGGHGDSPAERDDYSIASFGQDVAAVAADVDADRVVLVGHSMGGPVALDAAARLGDRVVGIVGVDTLQAAGAEPYDADRAEAMFATPPEGFAARMDALVRRVFFDADAPPELVDAVARDMGAGDPVVAERAGISHATFDVGAALRALEGVPIVLINAESPPTDVDALEDASPGSRVVVIPDSGHFPMLERPTEFNTALRAELERLAGAE